ncbi:IclR family transcriptional regulator [Humitalea rosea]|uniref:IclR family transcriptional regulator n=1 Tax=Humitalea rosea TaxID=990373 RepID=A0A2W7HXV1_9PROT|nr:IclR family transcriptional regulator C-terminal domain-containing protein [Humitalea rosea]PZW39304.1 IclR family transcriptional regulator [Humitalea rosea]
MSTGSGPRYGAVARDEVQSIAKGLAVIEAFGPARPAMTLSEVARQTGMSPGSAQRVLRTLVSLGYVGVEGTRFSLRPRTLQLGYAYLSSLPLAAITQPLLSALMAQTEETCSLAVLDGDAVVYVARAPARRLVRDYMSVGTRMPAHATSVGKVLLAALPEAALEAVLDGLSPDPLTLNTLTGREAIRDAVARARRDGFAVNDQETIMGLRSIAVPVVAEGKVVAALGLSAEVTRVTLAALQERLLPPLLQTAGVVAAALLTREQSGFAPWS